MRFGVTRRLSAIGRNPGAKVVAVIAGLAMTAGCNSLDSLLDVELPGDIIAEDLADPRLAETLVRSAQNDFECAFKQFVRQTGIWTTKLQDLSGSRNRALSQTRAPSYDFYADHCMGTEPNYAPLQTARAAGAFAYELISGYSAESLSSDKEQLLGTSKLYEAYAMLLLSESYCGVTFDVGPLLTRGEGLRQAEAAFSSVLNHAGRVLDAERASALRTAALVGRARTRLQLGDVGGVVSDAELVPIGFVFNATYDDRSPRRENQLFFDNRLGTTLSVGESYRPLRLLGGIPDPRVPIRQSDRTSSQAGGLRIWEQDKFTSRGSPIPIATGREAKIMIAEVLLGQTAVGIIDQLRRTPSGLVPLPEGGWPVFPVFASNDPVEIMATVKEERMRETFMQGTSVGDLLRWGGPWSQGVDERGRAFDIATCLYIPEFEVLSNPNFEVGPVSPTAL